MTRIALNALAAATMLTGAWSAAAEPSSEATAATPSPALADQPVMTKVTANGLVGELYAPAGPGRRHPAVLVLGGSEGGLEGSSHDARDIARHGYVALALAYFGTPGVPDELTNIPLEYFKTAVDFLGSQPDVDPGRIGLVGGSKGGEAALLIAAHYPQVKVVVAGVPANVAWQGFNRHNYADPSGSWTLDGKPMAFVPYDTSAPFTSIYDLYKRSLSKLDAHQDAIIPVERINGPVMLVCGGADVLWPSCPMSDAIVNRLKSKGFRHPVEELSYPNAGHGAFGPPIPAGNPALAMLVSLGGDGKGNQAARADSWAKAMSFLDRALKR